MVLVQRFSVGAVLPVNSTRSSFAYMLGGFCSGSACFPLPLSDAHGKWFSTRFKHAIKSIVPFPSIFDHVNAAVSYVRIIGNEEQICCPSFVRRPLLVLYHSQIRILTMCGHLLREMHGTVRTLL